MNTNKTFYILSLGYTKSSSVLSSVPVGVLRIESQFQSVFV